MKPVQLPSRRAACGGVVALAVALALANVIAEPTCETAADVCQCSAFGSRCGWCSHSGTCKASPACTTTCRECPHAGKFGAKQEPSCPECERVCINTCPAAKTVCACAELTGCGWCNTTQRCTVYPECTTTCEECAWDCDRPSCLEHCYRRFHKHTHKRKLFPLNVWDMACTVAIFFAVVMASAAGIGGGAVLVPLFTMLGGFTEHEAIPLSIATIFGGSMFSVLFNFAWMAHPLRPHRHVIAYDSAVILMPMTLAGVSVGVYLNKVCPNWLIMVLLVLLCLYTGRRTLQQGLRAYAKESAVLAAAAATSGVPLQNNTSRTDSDGDGTESSSLLAARRNANPTSGAEARVRSTNITPGVPRGAAVGNSSRKGEEEEGDLRDYDELREKPTKASGLLAVIETEGKMPWHYILMLGRVWLVVVLFALLKGGHGMPSVLGLECGSVAYWAAVLGALPVLLLLSRQGGDVVCEHHHHLLSLGYEYAEGDVVWNKERVRSSCSVVGVAAIAAGLLGVGGGMVLGPIFLELQMNPLVASATSTFMVLLMASCTIAQFVIFGMLDQSFASWYGFVGVCGAVVGTKGAKALVEKSGRTSMLIFVLAFLLFASGALMLGTGSVQLTRSGLTGFRSLCGRAGAAAAAD
mmetsp:Transcript_39253/g.96986  ORF Transcript_39253/g.96986 Transcript_39253/m.96986 type:complete len:638 (-) Transcript_39253:336-2249(-)|eukprot:CAMPEP_0179956296 /NCGR_PEP_ID=MMETSP0983-20121128/26817_1 /TAXON_ID=483367 /ORGANISM="non described non described, Strain CCMP 2436" /LENGTH=637 /DNA_ID=CAMNT_0021868141 /DNA_START=36 /DNA_END=1949 /DNA_ORIENTATION=+